MRWEPGAALRSGAGGSPPPGGPRGFGLGRGDASSVDRGGRAGGAGRRASARLARFRDDRGATRASSSSPDVSALARRLAARFPSAARGLRLVSASSARLFSSPAAVSVAALALAGAPATLHPPPPSARSSSTDAGGYRGGATSGDPTRACTDAVLWATGVGYVLQILSGHAVTSVGAKVNEKIARGQLWRLVTPALLHGGVVHLLVNCFSLNSLGPAVERRFGREQFWVVYVGSAVGGNYLSYRLCPNAAVGASSSIFGLVGAMAVYLHRHNHLFGEYGEQQLLNLVGSVGLNAAFGMMSKRIDNFAHLGGFLAGAGAAFALGPNFVPLTSEKDVREAVENGEKTGRVKGRAVVNRPLLQTYAGEFAREFRPGEED